ncbi:MAG TPA: hypothetical protein VFK11_02720 [Candidatus Saccharimonadales bacterium]|nr:hypothetical protein [Candidatus Saccharimonadales bacterium]
MPEQGVEAIRQNPNLSIRDRLSKGLALAGSVLAMAGGTLVREAVWHPPSAVAAQECTTTTTTNEVNGVTTTTESTQCSDTDESDNGDSSQPAQTPKNEGKSGSKDGKSGGKRHHKPKNGKTIHGPKTDPADSQKDFEGYDMGDSSFTDGNGCFVTGEASALRRVTGNPRIRPRSLYYPELRRHWGPDEKGGSVHGFLFDDVLPRTAARYGVKVWDTDFRGAVKAIKNGDQVMLLAEPGYFTDAGHYMDAWKVAGGNRLVIDDPNGKGKHGDSERPGGWSGAELSRAGVTDFRVLHLKRQR